MLVIIEEYGQLCNRLFQFANLIAFCRHNRLRLLNLAFYEYQHYFNSTAGRVLVAYPQSRYNPQSRLLVHRLQWASSGLLYLGGHAISRVLGVASIEFNEDIPHKVERLTSALQHRLVLVSGLAFWDSANFVNYGDEIRSYFLPKERYVRLAREVHGQMRCDSDVVVGVHVRRRDYAQWRNGRYYFEDHVYCSAMRDIADQLAPRRPSFLIASDEPLALETYENLGYRIAWARREPMVDLMALALCDFIVGPPSTFSRWASFYGKVPLHVITEPEQHVDLNARPAVC